jgi:hypothetical protein
MQPPDKLMLLGMCFLAIGPTMRLLHPSTPSAQNIVDGVWGMLIGLSIGFNLLAVWMRVKMRRNGQPPACA